MGRLSCMCQYPHPTMEADGNQVDWVAIGTLISSLLVAVATFFAARAAKRSGDAADKSAQFTRQASLLATIPRVVPWTTKGQEGKAINRGTSEAFNLSWTVIALRDGSTIHEDSRPDVLPVGSTQRLWDPTSEMVDIIRQHRAGEGIEIICHYWTSWGQEFTLRREVGMRRNKEPHLYDEDGEEVKIGV